MLERVPDYFDKFFCLADRCPRNCCVGWEVTVDEDTAARFQAVPGPFGERLRAALTRDAEGDRCFLRRDRRCPFLDGRNLCQVHQMLGAEYTARTCRLHPRFTEDFGPLRETSLSASCPMAAGLLLGSEAPLRFLECRTPQAEEPGDPWLPGLLALRERAIALLQCRDIPMRRRETWFLLFCNEAQSLLDGNDLRKIGALCEEYADLPAVFPAELNPGGCGLFPAALRTLETLEILEDDWLPLLRKAERTAPVPLPDWAAERIAVYFVFRYFLKAVNDGDLLSQAQLAVFGVLSVERLASAGPSMQEALYRFCREIEHDSENLEALRRYFCSDTALGLSSFLSELESAEAPPEAE